MIGDTVTDMKSTVVRVLYKKDLFAICECITEETIPRDARYFDYKTGKNPKTKIEGQTRFIAIGDGLRAKPEEKVYLSGKWEKSKKYGSMQLRISDCYDYIGTSEDEIVPYLESKLVKGVGKKIAKAIYDRFGAEVFTILDTNPEALMEVPGIKRKRFEKLIDNYKKNRQLHSLTRLLAPHGISYTLIVRINDELGEGAAARIRENPYYLCEAASIGFKRADEIAIKLGSDLRSYDRLSGAIVYTMSAIQHEEGHLYVVKEKLLEGCCKDNILNTEAVTERITPADLEPVLEEMIRNGDMVCVAVSEEEGCEEKSKLCIYSKNNFLYEQFAANAIRKKLKAKVVPQPWDFCVKNATEFLEVTLDEFQFEGAVRSLSSPISVITGGPGTGKTTGLRVIIETYKAVYPKKVVSLAAPTGRAARRMSEQAGMPAVTLHKLIGLIPGKRTNLAVAPNSNEMIEADLLVIDEASMIDAHLFAELMYRVSNRTQLIFLGDVDQLPSVGAGNVLRQLLECESVPYTRLTKVFRQKNGSVIPENAAKIRDGKNDLVESPHFKIFRVSGEAQGAAAIVKLCERSMKKGRLDETQILCPMKRRGACGTHQLNEVLQDIVNPKSIEKDDVMIDKTRFRTGDKVIQLKNTKWVSNGDIGRIQKIVTGKEREDIQISVFFESIDEVVEYEYEDALNLDLAYAITIHKSQGSEFPAVVVPIFKSMDFFLRRNLLYTAVTRAKLQVVVVTDMDMSGIKEAIEREDSSKRNTLLSAMIESPGWH